MHEDLKAIIASLYYLKTEAERIGLKEISLILKNVLTKIEIWLKGESSNDNYPLDLIDSDLFKTLTLMTKLQKLNQSDLRGILNAIEMCDKARNLAH